MRLIFFDIDGTLIRGQASGRRAVERAFKDVFALPEMPRTEAAVSFSGALDPDIMVAIAAFLDIESERTIGWSAWRDSASPQSGSGSSVMRLLTCGVVR